MPLNPDDNSAPEPARRRGFSRDLSDMRPRWLLVIATAPVIVAGIACSIAYRDLSMLWVSLVGAVLMLVTMPLIACAGSIINNAPWLLVWCIDSLRRLSSRRRR